MDALRGPPELVDPEVMLSGIQQAEQVELEEDEVPIEPLDAPISGRAVPSAVSRISMSVRSMFLVLFMRVTSYPMECEFSYSFEVSSLRKFNLVTSKPFAPWLKQISPKRLF